MKFADFRIPASLDEARSTLKELGPSGFPIAGGTSLVFIPGGESRTAVDITRLGLEGIQRENGAFRIGAATRLAALQEFHAEGWVLDQVARELASQQIRNISTLGGNAARVFPWADFPVALLALEAELAIAGEPDRVMKADEFFSGQPARLFKPGDLLTSVKVRALPAAGGFGYRKNKLVAMSFSRMTAAAVLELDGKIVRKARVAVGAGVPLPARLTSVEDLLIGRPASETLFKETVGKGVAGLKLKSARGVSDEYTAHLANVTAVDALMQAWKAITP